MTMVPRRVEPGLNVWSQLGWQLAPFIAWMFSPCVGGHGFGVRFMLLNPLHEMGAVLVLVSAGYVLCLLFMAIGVRRECEPSAWTSLPHLLVHLVFLVSAESATYILSVEWGELNAVFGLVSLGCVVATQSRLFYKDRVRRWESPPERASGGGGASWR